MHKNLLLWSGMIGFEVVWTVTVKVVVLCAVTPVGLSIDSGSFQRSVDTCLPMCRVSHAGRRQLSDGFFRGTSVRPCCQQTKQNIPRGSVNVDVCQRSAIFFSPGATTPAGGCILQPSSGL